MKSIILNLHDRVFLELHLVHSVLISWKTHLEITNPGFLVYSEEAKKTGDGRF